MSRSATRIEVTTTENASNKPTSPTMPIVSARPCKNVRETAPQMRLSARSTTANTHEPAQNTMITHVRTAPTPISENASIVSRRNLLEPRSEEHTPELQSRFGISYAL